MRSHEKIDVLLKIINTPNSVLGKHLSFDASYISRIRSGQRRIPRNHPFLEPLAEYATTRITEEYQKKILSEFMALGTEWPDDPAAVRVLLLQWLTREDEIHMPVAEMLSGLSAIHAAAQVRPEEPPAAEASPVPDQTTHFFYGNEGKRQAVTLFLGELTAMEHPPQLLLYSNEDFSWMYEDPEFAKKWAVLLFGYIKKGGHIKIAHTISRASGEMLAALQKWIPIYMTGAIEPYYYPKILDRVFRKTLFIAEGHSAIVASSIGEETQGALNCLIHDLGAVRAVEQEYWRFFATCKPLMQIFTMARQDQLLRALQQFHEQDAQLITVRPTPSFYTMPMQVAVSMTKRLDNRWLAKRQELSNQAFFHMMEEHMQLTELLRLPPVEQVLAGEVDFPMCDLFDRPGLRYTPEEFAVHLESVIEKLKLYPEYQVVLADAVPANELIYVKEDSGVILVKLDLPSIAFAVNEQRMVSAFWDYLTGIAEMGERKEKVIARLENYLQTLRKGTEK